MDLKGDLRTINAFLILTRNHCMLCWTKRYCEKNKRVNMQVEGGSFSVDYNGHMKLYDSSAASQNHINRHIVGY